MQTEQFGIECSQLLWVCTCTAPQISAAQLCPETEILFAPAVFVPPPPSPPFLCAAFHAVPPPPERDGGWGRERQRGWNVKKWELETGTGGRPRNKREEVSGIYCLIKEADVYRYICIWWWWWGIHISKDKVKQCIPSFSLSYSAAQIEAFPQTSLPWPSQPALSLTRQSCSTFDREVCCQDAPEGAEGEREGGREGRKQKYDFN